MQIESADAARRLEWLATALDQYAKRLEAGEAVTPETLDVAVAQLKGLRIRAFGRTRSGESARARIRAYLIEHVGEELPGEEIAEIAGVSEWARRLRELRAEGMNISQPTVGSYRLDDSLDVSA